MKIHEVAAKLGITPRAIRLYEAKGLLRPGRERDNGYRTFSERDAWRLQTIAALRDVGLGLERIAAMLDKLDRGDSAGAHHYLELQRMALASKWVEGKHALDALDELIGRLETKGRLETGDLFRLTGRLNEIRRQQASWIDAWRFDELAPRFDGSAALLSTGPALSQPEYGRTLDMIAQWTAPRPGEPGLDVGTGTGNLAGLLAARGARMSAVDQSKAMLAICREKHPEVAAKLGNALALPFADGRFAFVASAFSFHFLNAEQQLLALAEMDRVLKPGGRACLAGLMTEEGGEAAGTEPAKHCIGRERTAAWFRERGYVTVHYAINPQIGVLHAARTP
ncbi:methyltransferase domain-containing protein [Paenibacillus sp. MWE-103]|uniref:Methyltransferase domain-containing protein n=1 Tax=Paenibacillus artemisiicola TaxID=1172618 RepID=A0ABS3W9L4_9BACL|nr:methyltransferase domain-containing protein [Paenibacillus artemisiicola]MBO7745010.1 methyltransferase domain-containing protein [Paenibacillus artemisiicola]